MKDRSGKFCGIIAMLLPVLFLMVLPVSAQQASYETAAVGRVVGDSPAEMEKQLLMTTLNLKHASYFAEDVLSQKNPGMLGNEKKAVIESQFKNRIVKDVWDWGDVQNSLGKFEKQEYLIIETEGKGNPLEASGLKPENTNEWTAAFAETNPLFVFDSEYAGVYLPKKDSFVKRVGQDAVTVAPSSYSSREFTKALICNLGKSSTIGEAFRQARNNYYWGVKTGDELVGVTLLSYMLYGNPMAKVTVPSYNESVVEKNCKAFVSKPQAEAKQVMVAQISSEGEEKTQINAEEATPSSYKETLTFEIGTHAIESFGDYELIVADNTVQRISDYELVLPYQVAIREFPLKTLVKNVSLISLSDPVDISLPNLPSWEGELVKRTCYANQKSAGIQFSQTFAGDKEIVLVEINPVEVVDCTNGKFKLYTKATYKIDYIPFSPVLIKKVAVASEAFPGQSVAANVSLQNLQGAAFEGELVLSSIGSSGLKERVAEKKVSLAAEQQETAVELAFTAPENEGMSSYRLEFVQESEAKTFHEFSIKVKSLELSITAPATAGESGEATLTITNSLAAPVDAVISSYLLKGEETVTATHEKTLLPGNNEVKIGYEGLKREDASYDLLATVNYGSSKETAAATLVTNHPPFIESMADVVVTEGEKVALSPAAADIDGDNVEITYSGSMESSEWQTNVGDAGSYETTITATDGLLYDSQTVKITVLEDKDVDKDGYEKGVDCNDNDASINPAAEEKCNNVDDNCDGSTDESLQKTEPCGYCGTTTTACGNGQWLANVTCEGQGPCSPGTEETQSCGYGGKQFRKCSETCAWTQWSECGSQGECQAGEKQEQKCGTTDVGMCEYGTQSRTCKADYYWSLWAECSGSIEPAAELCDGLDNNCNGETDDGLEDLNSDGKCDSPPVLPPIGNRTVRENETLSIALAAYDFNGDSLAYSSSQLPQGAALSSSGGFTWAPTFSQAGMYGIEFTASDGLLQDKEQINITVTNINRAPEAKIVLEPAGQAGHYVNEGEWKLLKADVFDPDNDYLDYGWWYLGNADWWEQGKSKLVSKSKYYYFFPNYTDGDGNNVHKFLLNVSDGNLTVNVTEDIVVVNVQDCKPGMFEKVPCGSSVGACKQGLKNRTCGTGFKWGEWGECLGEVKPAPKDDCGTWEDEDCDGVVNNGCMESPDLAPSWMMWKLYDYSSPGSGEISMFSLGNASLTMRPYLYGEVINLGDQDSPPAFMVWYLNGRMMVRTQLPRVNASEKAPVSVYLPYAPYEGMNNVSLIVDANNKIKEKKENNNQIDFPITVKYNETHKPWAKIYGEDYYLRFPTQEECEKQGKCWGN